MKKIFVLLVALYVAMAAHAQTFPVQNLVVNGSATLAFPARVAGECKDILAYGGDNTGATSNDAALAAVVATFPTGKPCVVFGPGKFKFASQFSYTFANTSDSLAIFGAGSEQTELTWAGGGGIRVNYISAFNSVHIRDMALTTGTSGSGSALYLNQTAASIPNPGNSSLNDLTNLTIRGADGQAQINYWSTGIRDFGVSNVNFNGVGVYGNGTNAYSTVGTGADISGNASLPSVVYNFTNCTFNALNVGISYGNWVQGMSVSQSNFTGDAIGLNVPAGITGTDQLFVGGSQFNAITGINILTATESTMFLGNLFIVPQSGVGINLKFASLSQVIGNTFGPSTYSNTAGFGVIVGATALIGSVISGNSFYYMKNAAVLLDTPSTGNNVQSNLYGANGTNVANSGTGNTVGGGSQ